MWGVDGVEQRNTDVKSCHLSFDMGNTCVRFRGGPWGSLSVRRFRSVVRNVLSINWIIFPELNFIFVYCIDIELCLMYE
jgi:hypothetical protein